MAAGETEDFAQKTADLLARWLAKSATIQGRRDLLVLLGCAHLDRFDGSMLFVTPESCSLAVEASVARTLMVMLAESAKQERFTDESILDGLLQRGRWQQCLKSADTAYALATLLLDVYINDDEAFSEPGLAQHRHIKNSACELLGSWLHIDNPGTCDYHQLTRAMFGDAWHSMVVTGDVSAEMVPGLVRSNRPPFLPGLLPSHLEQLPQGLPDLGG